MAFYEKTLLYLMPDFKRLTELIDRKFMNEIENSKTDYSPAVEQCQKLIKLTQAKVAIKEVGVALDEILNTLTNKERDYINYKYCGKKQLLTEAEFKARTYFRKQKTLSDKIKSALIRRNFTEKWFYENLMSITYIKEVHRRVALKENENLS